MVVKDLLIYSATAIGVKITYFNEN